MTGLPVLAYAIGAITLLILLLIPFTRKIIFAILNLIPAFALFVLGFASLALWKPVAWLCARVPALARIMDQFAAGVERLGTRKVGLPAGDREAVARAMWPENRYPFLYSEVPDDIRRPLWEDGKLIGGQDIPWMADRHFSVGMTRAAGQCGLTATLIALVAQPVLFFLWRGASAPRETAAPVLLEQFPGEAPVHVSGWSVWQDVAANWFDAIGGGAMMIIMLIIAWLLIAIGIGIAVAVMMIEHWRKSSAAPYEILSKDAHVRWPYRAEAREIAHTGYVRQVGQATGYLQGSPLFAVGEGTGTFRLRGDLAAPVKGQTLALDRESLFQHVLVFGGTGDGKTTAILKPLLRQVLEQPNFGAYVTDAKGVLWHDAEKIATEAGRTKDVLRIGTGAGDLGVNVTAKLAPSHIAAVLRSVLSQIGGASGDSFWPDMAANVMRHLLTVGRAYGATPEGEAAAKQLNPYSLWWAYQAALDEKRLKPAIEAINRATTACLADMDAAHKAGDTEAHLRHADRLSLFAGADIAATLGYLTEVWPDMAKDTKTGIVANISQLMDGFAGATVLRERFISGQDEHTASLDAPLNGKIALITLNTLDDGLPARLVAILLKTVLYREARLREAALKKSGGNPQANPCLVMMDEVQELATVDPASGLSDATFWNVARSTGLAGVFATQTVAALTQAMGDRAAENFMQQSRSKIFLRSEDQATVSYACWLAGEFERNRVFGDGQWESLEQRELVSGWTPFLPLGDDAAPEGAGGAGEYFRAAMGFIRRASIGTATAQPTYAPDMRFVPEATDQATQLAALGARQQAAWRQEDLDRRYRTEGNAMSPALTPADFIAMGRWHAYAHVQRAGLARQDVVALKHDFDQITV
ncbi:type IV secretory system conjugative DNA transfer family protein [Parerythrobacter lacustris]|uniref:Type IV secretory system conjugative DNA transfer family protein n=1 Tax=Parerythrobacter lacustris TaxID=2969984 RepID=A0ABT1XL61_9SPHN|nr:type IV secretory system conjugative DNA transfer family protein [Parerythrobacter lacustris]MCR2832398.1 type IV secretory system conjugative DNA transfer family protein [Parerythrobacter lacustris]